MRDWRSAVPSCASKQRNPAERQGLANLPDTQPFTLYKSRVDEAGIQQREVLGTCPPRMIPAFASQIDRRISEGPDSTSYEVRVRIGAESVQAVLDWMEDLCRSAAARIAPIDFKPLYPDQIVKVVRLTTEIGISYAVLGLEAACHEYRDHYGPDATYELWSKAQRWGCPAIEAICGPPAVEGWASLRLVGLAR